MKTWLRGTLAAAVLLLLPALAAAQQISGSAVTPFGIYNLVPPTVATGRTQPFQLDSSGNLKVVPQSSQIAIGNVGGKTTSVCVTPTVTVTNSYGTNYVIGGKLTFANALTSTGSGILQGVTVTIKALETSGFTFFPFTSDPSATTWTDAAVAAINATDVPKVRNPVSLSLNSQLAATGFTVASNTALGQSTAPGATSIFGVLIANAALTTQFASATDVQVCIQVLNDL